MRKLMIATAFLAASPAFAQGIHVVKPLPGYACMNVKSPPGKLDWSQLPRMKSEPAASAADAGAAATTVFARNPLHVVDGYAELVRLDGKPAWLPVNLLTPYRSLANPNAHCVPSVMSNGMIGMGG